jgi:hypothetical protein
VQGLGPYPHTVEINPVVRADDPLQLVFIRM